MRHVVIHYAHVLLSIRHVVLLLRLLACAVGSSLRQFYFVTAIFFLSRARRSLPAAASHRVFIIRFVGSKGKRARELANAR